MSVISTLLVGVFGFFFGYSLFVNITLGVFAVITLVVGLFSFAMRKFQTEAKHIWKSFFAIVVSMIVLCCVILSYVLMQFDLYKCEKFTGIKLPAGRCVHFKQPSWHFAGSETMFYVKVTMDKDDVESFLKSEPFHFDTKTITVSPNSFYKDHDFLGINSALPFGWNPDELEKCWGTNWQANAKNANGHIYVNVGDPKKAIIYLYVQYQ